METVMIVLHKNELKELHQETLRFSAEAVKARPLVFSSLEDLIDRALGPVDVDEYENLAQRISSLLSQLCQVTYGTIFYDAWKRIDPAYYGAASSFRMEIKKLAEAINEIEEYMKP
jgi:hypothetical protein